MKPAPPVRGLVRGLAWGLAAAILLPIVLAVTLGTGSLLAAVGDPAAAAACRWAAVVIGMLWLVALAATTIACGLLAVVGQPLRERRRHHLPARRRTRRDPRDAGR